jgi:O-antigen/teichoic acid export membrane protein
MEGTERSPPVEAVGSLLRALVAVIGSTAAARALSLAKGLVVASLLTPSEYGVATLVAVVVAYSSFADFGTSTAAARELSLAVGRSDTKAQSIAAGHLSALRLLGGVLAALAAFGASWLPEAGPTRLGLRWALPVAITSSVVAAALLSWQAQAKSRQLAKATFVLALLDAAFAIVLTRQLGLAGLLLALLAAPLLTTLWCGAQRGLTAPRLPDRATLYRYLAVGLPWVALALVEHNVVYVDHLLVLGYFGVHDLGIYNVALIVADIQRMFALAVGIVLGPRLLQRYGSSGSAMAPLHGITLTPVLALAAVLPFLVVPLYFGAKAGLQTYYPLYADAAPILGILLVGGMFLGLNNGVSSFLLAVGKQGRGAIIGLGALVCDVVIAGVLVKTGLGLASVAWASLAAYVLFTAINLTYVHGHFEPSASERATFLARAFVPVAYAAAMIAIVDARYPRVAFSWGLVVPVLASWLLISPLAWQAVRLVRLVGALCETPPGDATSRLASERE